MLAANADLNPGKYVRLRVSDTGVGMNEKTLERAFELSKLRVENRSLRTSLKVQREQRGLLGNSPSMDELREKIQANIREKNEILTKIYDYDGLDEDKIRNLRDRDRLIEIIDFINDGKRDKIIMSMKEAFDLKEFLRGLKWKVNTSPT